MNINNIDIETIKNSYDFPGKAIKNLKKGVFNNLSIF